METNVAKDNELGRELARVRELAGLTQAVLAARLGREPDRSVEDGKRRTAAGGCRIP